MAQSGISFEIPADLNERSRRMRIRNEAGEPLTYQNLADALGLPFDFASAAVGITIALQSGQPVVIGYAAIKPMH
jgi:hypothetical protein